LQGVPWLGHFWGIPLHGTQSAHHFYEWSKKYGPIYAWKVFGETHLWISSDKIARDLLGGGGKKYADRPELPGALGIRSGSEFMPLMTYGDNWRRHRSFITALMRDSASKRFNDVPQEETKLMLRRFLKQPDKWSAIAIMMSARTSSRLAFGSVEHAGRLLDVIPPLLFAVSPAGMLPNLIPQLQYLPAFLSPWKRREAKRRAEMAAVFTTGLAKVESGIAAGVEGPSWARTWLQNPEIGKLDTHEAAHAIGTISAVGIGTLASPVHTYVLAMCYYPALQPKIQEEIDRVCGGRMPKESDLPSLPLLRAICKECLRWRSSTPGGNASTERAILL
jgi:cytochrome P450